jgi:glycosyltransferase involved in cell wall biosynthesis
MRIYPIYSSSLRKALAALTGSEIPVITTNCMCFDKDNPVDEDYDFIKLPYLTRRPSRTELRRHVRAQLYPPLEYLRGRALASRSNDFDVVDFQQSSYAFGYEALKSFLSSRSRAKKIVTIHKLDAIQKEKPELNLIYNQADGVITFSKYMKEMLVQDGVRPSKISVVFHGTSLAPLEDTSREQAILFCGSPIPRIKGFEHYVIALRLLREEGIDLKTKVYGFFMEDEKEYAEWLAAEQGVEGLLTWQSFRNEAELTEEYQNSLVCVIPYTGYAGYFPAAYAMGNAVPVVATDILGHSEYVAGAGLMVPPASPKELVSALRRVLEDEVLRKELGDNGRKRAEETMSWETVAAQTLDVFGNVLGGR